MTPCIKMRQTRSIGLKILVLNLKRRNMNMSDVNKILPPSDQKLLGTPISNPILDDKKIVYKSEAMHQLMHMVERVAPSTATVLIMGESGTGKELIAHAIHEKSSRHDKPFVAINCGALRETLLESELFGHEKGAFTGAYAKKIGLAEVAAGGTLFLDEIGEMSQVFKLNFYVFYKKEKSTESVVKSQLKLIFV